MREVSGRPIQPYIYKPRTDKNVSLQPTQSLHVKQKEQYFNIANALGYNRLQISNS